MTLDVVLSLAVVVLTPAVGWLISTVIAHGRLLARLDERDERQVTRDDLHELGTSLRAEISALAVSIANLRGDLHVNAGKVDSIQLVIRRHEEWLNRESK